MFPIIKPKLQQPICLKEMEGIFLQIIYMNLGGFFVLGYRTRKLSLN